MIAKHHHTVNLQHVCDLHCTIVFCVNGNPFSALDDVAHFICTLDRVRDADQNNQLTLVSAVNGKSKAYSELSHWVII